MRRRAPDMFALAVVLGSLLAVSPWWITDVETYMRLAIGRAGTPRTDPWIFSIPDLPWRNHEWLGDWLLYKVYLLGGERGLVLLKLEILGVGWMLLFVAARVWGASPLVAAALCVLALAGAHERMTERNEMHLHWLIPLYAILLRLGRRDRRWLLALLPAGLLWANLHASSIVGAAMIAVALVAALVERDRRSARWLAVVLAAHPLLALATPDGVAAYALVIDHLRHASAFGRVINEWLPPHVLPFTWARVPLYLLSALAIVSLRRRRVEATLLVLALCAAHRSVRLFLPAALIALPPLAAHLSELRRRLVPVGLGLAALALMIPAVVAAQSRQAVRDRLDLPSLAGRWLAAHAPAGARLFGPYSGSQLLMWDAPSVRLYIHPNFSFEAEHLFRYLRLLEDPVALRAELERQEVDLVLVTPDDETQAFGAAIAGAQAVYWDGHFSVYARKTERTQALRDRYGYRKLRPGLIFDPLADLRDEDLQPDLDRLTTEAPAIRAAIAGFRLLVAAERSGNRGQGDRARQVLSAAVAALPRCGVLASYIVRAHLAAGDTERARRLLTLADAQFRDDPHLAALRAKVY